VGAARRLHCVQRLHARHEGHWDGVLPQLQLACFAHLTHQQHGQHASGGRIDAIWLSDDLVQQGWLHEVRHLHGPPVGDHAAVLLRLTEPDTPPLGKRRWIFPLDLLGQQDFLRHMGNSIRQFKQSWQPPTQAAAPPSVQRWEDLKRHIKAVAIAWRLQARQQQQHTRKQLQQQLHTKRHVQALFPGPHAAAQVLAARKALQVYEQAAAEHRAACRGAVHEVYGTTGSYYFFRQGKQPPDMQPIRQVQAARSAGHAHQPQPAGRHSSSSHGVRGLP